MVAYELGVDLHVGEEGQHQLPEADAGLGESLLQLRAEHLVQHQQALAGGRGMVVVVVVGVACPIGEGGFIFSYY